MNEGTILDGEVILLKFVLDVLNEPLVSDISQLFFKFVFLFIVYYRNEDLVDESQTVVAHKNVVCVEDGLGEWFKKR